MIQRKRWYFNRLASIVLEKSVRPNFHLLFTYKAFLEKKEKMMKKMPIPRRKQWWEKWAEN